FLAPGSYAELACKGRPCTNCGKCRDWYYEGDLSTWEWIISVKNWDEEDRKLWDDGNFSRRFKRRDRAPCNGSFGYYYDRRRNYHGGHIRTYIDCECGEGYDTYFTRHGYDGCGYRYNFIGHVFSYCQCSENIKKK
ncbi:unnamed protein product, partial [Rotaria sp. Silwood2]